MKRIVVGARVLVLTLGCLLWWTMSGVMSAQNPTPLEHEAQKPVEGSQPATSGGVSTGGAHPVVLDAQHRPMTAGGFVSTGPVVFKDIAEAAGLTKWTHKMGTPEKSFILETVGSGVALLDYDNDGWLDIYLVNGSTFDAESGKTKPPHAALFHNNHDGTFTDVAEKAGVTLGNWSTGATWGDYDGDGLLDLFVPGYVHYDVADQPKSFSFCQFRGVKVMCGPRGLHGEPDHLFHNNGDGTFTDVSERAGVADKNRYYGLASLFVDVNGDGKPDLLVADDSTPNYLYINKGDGTFEDDSFASGYALNESGRETASMGIAAGDLLHKGQIDLYNTTFSDDYNPLYRNDGSGNFTDTAYQDGIAEVTIPFLGWGTAFFDYDNDGWLDLFVVNGHVYPQVDAQNWGTTWAQRPLLFHSENGKLKLVPAVEGTGLAKLATSRGMAYGDLFNDGHIDVVVNNMDAPPSLFRNVVDNGNHWIAFKMAGAPATEKGKKGSPRDGVGTCVFLTANGFTQRADVLSGGSFASSSDQRPHFGLGKATKIEKIEVRWPSGKVERVAPPATVDKFYVITEGKGIAPMK